MKRGFLLVLLAALPLLAPRALRADEFKLKDGSTIVGSVVGYVGNSFKVKTSYGYALVEKDKIVSIRIAGAPDSSSAKNVKSEAEKSEAAEKPASKLERNTGAEEHAAAKKSTPSLASSPAAAATSLNSSANPSPAPVTASVNADLATGAHAANPVTEPSASTATIAATVPVAPPEPQPIREQVTGNTYVNETYEFRMYKPPDWQVMDGARSVLPGAIAAMGTDDQTTYLVIAQEPAGKSSATEIAATENRLSEVLANFRPLGDEHLTISGQPEVVHRFRGSVDEHDWSGFMAFLPRGAKLYTIFGMTRADNDLVQIQENVIIRTISSFQFLPQ